MKKIFKVLTNYYFSVKSKHIAGGVLIAAGAGLAFKGAVSGNQSMINAGIGGVFLGVVVLTFSTSDYIKYDAFKAVALPYREVLKKLVGALEIENRAVYIPPYDNLPEGGIFLPLHREFDIDLAKLDRETLFLTDVGREKEMGLLLPSLGRELMEMYEGYSEVDFSSAGLVAVENASSSVLRSLGLAKSVTIEERGDRVKVFVGGIRAETCSRICEQTPCPICGSILLSITKAEKELIAVESFRFEDGVEISAVKMGGIDRWM